MSDTYFDDIETELAFAVLSGDMDHEHSLRMLKLIRDPHRKVELRAMARQSGKTTALINLAHFLEKLGFSVALVSPSAAMNHRLKSNPKAAQLNITSIHQLRATKVDIALVDEPWHGVDPHMIGTLVVPAAEKVYGLGTPV